LTEKRSDFGVVTIREPYTVIEEEEEDERPELHPNYEFDKMRKLTFKYHDPMKGLKPKHTPEKIKHPEMWKFYDYDLDKIDGEIA
jgi:hypothetical protein